MNFYYTLQRNVDLYPDKVAWVDVFKEKRYTNVDFAARVSALAAGLKMQGIRKGDRIAVLVYNCLECFEIFFAALKLGAVYVPVNFRLSADEIAYVLNDAGASALVSETEFVPLVDSVRSKLSVKDFLILDDATAEGWVNYESVIKENRGADFPYEETELDDLQRIMYTSGTTSHPKGAMITHGNLFWKCMAHILEFKLVPEDICLAIGPLYHAGGMDVTTTGVICIGGSVLVLRKFDPGVVLQTIEKEKVTIMWAAPIMMEMILDHPQFDQYDLSSWRTTPTGGAKSPLPLLQKTVRKFPQMRYLDGFGMTETVSADVVFDLLTRMDKSGSIGQIKKPVMFVRLRVVNEQGQDCMPNEPGELLVKGPKVFKGYWNNPVETAKALVDGWLHTGDIAVVDEDGFIYLVDRKKDMIISGGENIGCLEVERVLDQHPKVLQSAVVGVQDEKWGEVPKAYVVLKPGEELTIQEVKSFCEGKLAHYKIPKFVEAIDDLPKTTSGKVKKYELRRN